MAVAEAVVLVGAGGEGDDEGPAVRAEGLLVLRPQPLKGVDGRAGGRGNEGEEVAGAGGVEGGEGGAVGVGGAALGEGGGAGATGRGRAMEAVPRLVPNGFVTPGSRRGAVRGGMEQEGGTL